MAVRKRPVTFLEAVKQVELWAVTEKREILSAVRKVESKRDAALLLGVGASTVYRKLDRYELEERREAAKRRRVKSRRDANYEGKRSLPDK